MQVFRSEVKVGLLILVAFMLLSAGIFITSDLRSLWDKKKTLVFLFPYADGIGKGSPVWYAGFEVGEVSDIRIAKEARDRIAVTVKIDPEAQVRRDSRIEIRSLGMMGAKYVEISPGSSDSPEVGPGETFEGKSPASLSQVIATGQQAAARLVELISEAQALVHEVRSEASIKEVVQNANGLLVEMRGRSEDLKPLVQKLDKFADSLTETGQHLESASGEGGKEFTALLKELRDTNKAVQKRLENVEIQLTKTLGQASKGFVEAETAVKGVNSLVSSSEKDILSLLKNLKETSRHIEALSEDLRSHPYKVIWKEEGSYDLVNPRGSEQWREKGRIGPHGKE
jgi:phospholipid/cholesterol/gamma-HCH transport system substrate-binding protein